MKYGVVGGGPAGLYFALLVRKADSGAEVRVVERNGPDATFGWGVVFSEETLGALRDADFESYTQIQEYLQLLISKGLIMHEEGTQLYKLTEKGLHFIRSYEQISDVLAIGGSRSSRDVPMSITG